MNGKPLRIKRPHDYNPAVAATIPHLATAFDPAVVMELRGGMAPSTQGSNMSAAAPSTGTTTGNYQVFLGGLPYNLTDEQVRTRAQEIN